MVCLCRYVFERYVHLLPVPCVVALVRENPKEPSLEFVRLPTRSQRTVCADERFLHRIGCGIGIAAQPRGISGEISPVPLHQNPEVIHLAGEYTLHQRTVREAFPPIQ